MVSLPKLRGGELETDTVSWGRSRGGVERLFHVDGAMYLRSLARERGPKRPSCVARGNEMHPSLKTV